MHTFLNESLILQLTSYLPLQTMSIFMKNIQTYILVGLMGILTPFTYKHCGTFIFCISVF